MQIDEGDLRDFAVSYQECYGEAVSLDEARETLFRLVHLYELLARPLPSQAKHKPQSSREP